MIEALEAVDGIAHQPTGIGAENQALILLHSKATHLKVLMAR